MSIWHCVDHGLTGPMGCCAKAQVARIDLNTPPPVVHYDATPIPPRRTVWLPGMLVPLPGVPTSQHTPEQPPDWHPTRSREIL